ncbi:mammalian cell entry protein [Mycobacterium colombiense]|uniref:mammalian cell entry protein n=1 Tax=Mycobacterium colombiense TaxID=339268 RepID=UPI0007ED7334|nr:mammalian cell entry protein [Mycobacterium colombiense]OBJ33037.1 mammalian cell entry protein [Mycobacterium colombiense]OBJ71330.1 mammalian cell entry protein [Mycobacterium colombiense]
MDPAVADEPKTTPRVRRRASRAAGPAKGDPARDVTVLTEAPAAPKPPAKPVKAFKSIKPPPRRQPHRARVAWISFAAALLAVGALAGCVAALLIQQRHATAAQSRDQRFVDTATQTVVNMFSYKQDNIDESVNRFVNGTSGPLRGMLGANNNVENLKGLFRSTNATSEAVINGAALEGIDAVSDNASVLVSVRVTVADIDGVNKPSMPYRLRVIVHEDEAGKMTGYDLKYPDGGN